MRFSRLLRTIPRILLQHAAGRRLLLRRILNITDVLSAGFRKNLLDPKAYRSYPRRTLGLREER
jgi:hypothetical protein